MKVVGHYNLSVLLVSILLGLSNCEEQVVSGSGMDMSVAAPTVETLNLNAKLDNQLNLDSNAALNVNKVPTNGRGVVGNEVLNKNLFNNRKYTYNKGMNSNGRPKYDRNPYDEKPRYDEKPSYDDDKDDKDDDDDKPSYDKPKPYDDDDNQSYDKPRPSYDDEKPSYDKPRRYDYDDDDDYDRDDRSCYLRNGVFHKPKCPDTRRRCNRGNSGAFCYPNKYGKNDCPPCWVFNRETCNWDCYDYQPNSNYDNPKCIFDWIDIWDLPRMCRARYDD